MHAVQLADTDEQIVRCFAVLHQLRPALLRAEFVSRIRTQQAEGYRLAFLEQSGTVAAVAGFRMQHVLWSGKTLYVDDLVTDAAVRSQGHGGAMIQWLISQARQHACDVLSLDSGTHRHSAHAFYFRHGLRITDFHFQLKL